MNPLKPGQPGPQSQIKTIDDELAQAIQQAQQTGAPNMKSLQSIQQELTNLANNPQVPPQVRENLQLALNELKQIQGSENIGNLYTAKMQIDSALQAAETQQSEGGGEQGLSSELGGGGGGGEEG